MKISVCMATYNGERFIIEQIDSILNQLSENDELIIFDDKSTDSTIRIILSYNDPRIFLHQNAINIGHVKNFESCIKISTGDYIFLSDQDDIWPPGRVDNMIKALQSDSGIHLVASNFDIIDEFGNITSTPRNLKSLKGGGIKQITKILLGKAPYFGCTFAFKKEFKARFLPIPKKIESHDIWMALIACHDNSIINLPFSTLLHRVHNKNATPKSRRTLNKILKSRFIFINELIKNAISHKLHHLR